MKFRKTSLFIGLMSVASLASFAGAMTGTIAWYANSNHVTVEYTGTSVSSSQQLQIGLYFTGDYNFTSEERKTHELTAQDIDGTTYYWVEPGHGLTKELVTAYLGKQGYATTELEPVTTREYSPDGTFNLYKCPTAFTAEINKAALKSAYCKIQLAFRVLQPTLNSVTYRANREIWLSDATAESTADGHKIDKALRLYFNNGETGHKFVVAPSANFDDGHGGQILQGTNKVAGLLNLNNDEYYDCDADGEEIIYGDYSGNSFTKTTSFSAEQATGLDDVNATGLDTSKPANASTFLARHEEGMNGYLSGTFVNQLNAKTATYYTKAKIAPTDDGYGNLSGGVYVAKTANFEGGEANSYKAVGTTDMYVYIEGWDHAVIDTEISFGFNLGLTFQINNSRS